MAEPNITPTKKTLTDLILAEGRQRGWAADETYDTHAVFVRGRHDVEIKPSGGLGPYRDHEAHMESLIYLSEILPAGSVLNDEGGQAEAIVSYDDRFKVTHEVDGETFDMGHSEIFIGIGDRGANHFYVKGATS